MKKLIAVGTNEPDPEKWQYSDIHLYVANSLKEALKMEYPHGYCKECPACFVDMSKSRKIAEIEYIDDLDRA